MLFSLLFIERRNQDRREKQTLGLIFKPKKIFQPLKHTKSLITKEQS